MEDFAVDTEGRCFFCAENTPSIRTKSLTGLTHSLQYLSLYLEMNKRKVFDEEGHVPRDLLAKVERSRLTATLCDECSLLNNQFSKLYRQLEMTELQIQSCLNFIHVKLMKAEGKKTQDVFKYDQPESKQNGKQRIVHVLRTEAVQKCSQRLNGVKPKIKVRKLRTEEVAKKILKLKRNSLGGKTKQRMDSTGDVVEKQGVNEQRPVSRTNIFVVDTEPHSSKYTANDDDHDYQEDGSNFNDLDRDEAESDQSMGVMEADTDRSGGEDGEVLSTAFPPEENMMSLKKRKYVKSETGKYACKDCQREFARYSAFYVHYRTEHLKIRYKCSLCESTFTQKGHYDRHHRTAHMGLRFKCTVCNKSFTRKQHLKGHPCVV